MASWDTTYTRDLSIHIDTPTHTGQDWFSDHDASTKVLRYLLTSSALKLDPATTSFFDLGTGNGEMLFLLRGEGGCRGRMIGVDYSDTSVEFCRKRRQVLQKDAKNEDEDFEEIDFEPWDIMRSSVKEDWIEGFDVVLDKGTFDAISLSEETDVEGTRTCEGYRARVEVLVKQGGYLLVTSCNWTEDELKVWFEGGQLKAVGRVEYPVFRFGGHTGQSISTICFRKT